MDRDRNKDQGTPEDRSRLAQGVHQTDRTESKVNEDFIEFLKTKGPTWLLVVVVAVAAYLGMVRYRGYQAEKENEAWTDYADYAGSADPQVLLDVANDHEGKRGINVLTTLGAADRYLNTVQLGRALQTSAAAGTPSPITDEERETNLAEADRLYDKVIELDDGKETSTVYAVNAMFGKAAVAECRRDAATAREWYQRAGERASDFLPGLAALAEDRLANVEAVCAGYEFRESTPTAELPSLTPVSIDPSFRAIIEGDAPEENG